jgi:hypothetical protein
VQHDAILSTLALLQPAAPEQGSADAALPRLPSVYPQILDVLRPPGRRRLARRRARSGRRRGRLARQRPRRPGATRPGRRALPPGAGGTPASYALHIDLHASVPQGEWPMDRATSPVRVTLEHAGQHLHHPERPHPGSGWPTAFARPWPRRASRWTWWRCAGGLGELPWLAMLGLVRLHLAATVALALLWRQRVARRRAEELLRLGQVARLNTLGELAAGMAHELNQPLTALLSGTQAAQRLLGEDPPDLETARTAMARAVEQARRASDVVGRLRRLVERPDLAGQAQPLQLPAAVHDALHLLEPECRARAVVPEVHAEPHLPAVLAEPVALQQIVHNLW